MNSINHVSSQFPGFCGCSACLATVTPGIPAPSGAGFSRRRFFGTGLAGAAGGLLAAVALDLALGRAARAATSMTPGQALQELRAGNQRFVEQRLASFDQDFAILRQKTVDKQEPFAAVLACADSRMPVELIFDQSIGHIFVARVAGNVATAEMIASLEYGVAVLGTKSIMVLGHRNCGAVKAAISAKEAPGQISALYSYIRPAVDQAGDNIDAVSRANAKIQAAILRESSPVLAEFIKKGSLEVVAGFYDLGSGRVEILN